MALLKYALVLLTIGTFITCIGGVLVEVFDSVNFTNPLHRYRTEECINLRIAAGFSQEVMSLTTDTCIMLYKEPDCQSYYIRLDPGMYADLALVKHAAMDFAGAKSFVACTNHTRYSGSGLHLGVKGTAMIIGDENPPFIGTLNTCRDVCGCTNLFIKSPYIGTVTDIENWGNCVKLYEQRDCRGKSLQLLGGVSPESEAIPSSYSFVLPGTSIAPCKPMPHCHTLSFEVYKFILTSTDSLQVFQNKSLSIPIGAKTLFSNNRSVAATGVYDVNTDVEEIVEVTRISSFGHSSNRFSTSNNVAFEFIGSWPSNLDEVKNAVSNAYHTSVESSNTGEKYISKLKKPFAVRHQMDLSPCYEYVAESYVTVVKQMPAGYEFYATVTGKTRYSQLSAAEIEERLTDGLAYVQDIDTNTIMVRGAGTMTVDYSLDATVEGRGAPLENCLMASVSNDLGSVKDKNTI